MESFGHAFQSEMIRLRSDGETTLLRVSSENGQSYLALLDDVALPPASSDFTQKATDGIVSDLLVLSGCPAVVAPVTIDGKVGFLLEDLGGLPLDVSESSSRSLELFLQTSLAICGAILGLHKNNVVHGDIRPANIMIEGSDSAYLLGVRTAFQMAKRPVPRESNVLSSSRLPYLSPESTGRLDRLPDMRSDLYSLGVTLYELLTGKLPFAAKTAADWIHSHLARPPLPPGRWTTNIPSAVASVLMKLLSKAAEERYQTIQGLIADLEFCRSELVRHGRIELPTLGRSDARGTLVIPDQLYGRENELLRLSQAYDRIALSGKSEVVLVSGLSGVGKSALVGEFHRRLNSDVGLFAEGKFDQINRHVPLATLVQAFRGLVSSLPLSKRLGQEEVSETVKAALGANGKLISSLIPELERLIGPQADVPSLPPSEAQNRFQFVLSRFAGAFSSPGHPLVLFLDDLQWADHATLDFLRRTVESQNLRHTLIIGAFRSNEVLDAHPLHQWLDDVGKADTTIPVLDLSPLSNDDVQRLVSDSLGVSAQEAEPLAAVLFDLASGNPLFTTQLLVALVQDGRLAFDPQTKSWNWHRDSIAESSSEDVMALLAGKLTRLTPIAKDVVSTMALLGNVVCIKLLRTVVGLELEPYQTAVDEAVNAGLILRRDQGLMFVHDRVQEAAFNSADQDKRAALHLNIARRMVTELPEAELETRIFTVAQQYNRAVNLVHDGEERIVVARLNLRAGQRAEESSAFASALTYFEYGISQARLVSGPKASALAFEFEINIADCEFVIGRTHAAELRLQGLRRGILTTSQLARVTWSQITLYTAKGELSLAIELCLDYLRQEGIDWSANPTWDEVLEEYRVIESEIADRLVEQRATLPKIASERLPILDVLGAVLPPAFFSDQNLVCLILCRMANISRASGNTAASPLGYAYLGMVLGPMFGNYAAGYRFGKLGLELSQVPELSKFRGRVSMTFSYHVLPYSEPIRSGRELHRQALTTSHESGDLTYAGFSTCTTISGMLMTGDQLGSVERRANVGLDFVKQLGFGLIADIVTSQTMLVRCLQGLTFSLDTFDDGDFDEVAFEARISTTPGLEIAACWHWIRRMESAVFAGDYQAAVVFATKARPLLWTTAGHLEFVENAFFECIALARTLSPEGTDNVDEFQRLRGHVASLNNWCINSPENFEAHSELAQAELARLEKRQIDAFRHYENAIAAGEQNHLPHLEALANELASGYCDELGLRTIGNAHRERAYNAYRRWGAGGKLRDMEIKYPELATVPDPTVVPGATGAVPRELDLQSLVRSSASVAGEAVQSRMVRTLLSIALENAGAQRALLILPKQHGMWVEADAVADAENIEVTFRREQLKDNDFSMPRLRDAFRTQEPIVLDGDTIEQQVGTEQAAVTSGLVVPLVARGKSVGLILLENRLHQGAFSPARIAVLKLIAAQAAISLENASLDEKESLLREVHHRVKNNLQLISSLLNLQASRMTDPKMAELLQDSRNRVRSMALVHENLYRAGNFARIAMASHLRTLCAHLLRAYGTREKSIALNVHVDEVDLNLDSAVSCGLIVNELVSNALKHAFPDRAVGQIEVVLAVKHPTYELIVSDDGVGLKDGWKGNETLGLQLVTDLVDQLRGSLSIQSGNGTKFSITFKTTQH